MHEIHPSTKAILPFFDVDQDAPFRPIHGPFYRLANDMAYRLSGPELTAGLRKLLEARDCMIRAASSE